MGWTTTNWDHADWASLANMTDFRNAYAERGGTFAAPAIGDDCQGYVGWFEPAYLLDRCQRMILGGGWAKNDVGPIEALAGIIYTERYERIGPHWSRDDITSRLYGSPRPWFRRATEWPADWHNPDDPAYQYGYIQRGDIIGPWLFKDIQTGFGLCTRHMHFSLVAEAQSRTYSETNIPLEESWDSIEARFQSIWPGIQPSAVYHGATELSFWTTLQTNHTSEGYPQSKYGSIGQRIGRFKNKYTLLPVLKRVAFYTKANLSDGYGPDHWKPEAYGCPVAFAPYVSGTYGVESGGAFALLEVQETTATEVVSNQFGEFHDEMFPMFREETVSPLRHVAGFSVTGETNYYNSAYGSVIVVDYAPGFQYV